MAEQQGPAAPFPTPPPFYKHFTKQNIARLRQLRREAGVLDLSERERQDIDVLSLPPELCYLVPPSPPSGNKFQAFGQEVDLNPKELTLADANVEQLYPSHTSVRLNPQPQLLALARSMLTSFLSLTGILSQNPELYEDKADDLRTIVFNMHDLINQYRPHQARQSLISLMEDRLKEMQDEIKRIDDSKDKVSKLLQSLQNNGMALALQEDEAQHTEDGKQDIQAVRREARQRSAWAALEGDLG